MVAAARAVGVEFMRLLSVRDEVFPRGRFDGNRTSRRNVIGSDAVAENRKHFGAMNVRERRWRLRHVLEIRRQLDVGRLPVPLVDITFWNRALLPVRVTL